MDVSSWPDHDVISMFTADFSPDAKPFFSDAVLKRLIKQAVNADHFLQLRNEMQAAQMFKKGI